jgi:hypothetical protein
MFAFATNKIHVFVILFVFSWDSRKKVLLASCFFTLKIEIMTEVKGQSFGFCSCFLQQEPFDYNFDSEFPSLCEINNATKRKEFK